MIISQLSNTILLYEVDMNQNNLTSFSPNNSSIIQSRCIETPSSVAKDTFLYVQETGILKCTSNEISRRENMDSFLIVYVLSGEGFFTYNDKRTKVTSGACFFIDCIKPYSHESNPEKPWELIWVHFNGKQAYSLYDYYIHAFTNVFYPTMHMDILDNMRKILKNTTDKPAFHEAINSNILTNLLTNIIVTPKLKQAQQNVRTSVNLKLEDVKSYIQNNYTASLTLENLSERFLLSKCYLSREFKRKYNEGIPSYINNLRINRAKEMLRFTDKKISEIAILCGITDINYFIKLFKLSENLTPLEYRKKWKE